MGYLRTNSSGGGVLLLENEALQNEINTIRSSYINPSDLELSSLPAATGEGYCPKSNYNTAQNRGYFYNGKVEFYNNNGDFELSHINSYANMTDGKGIKVLKSGFFLVVLFGASTASAYGRPRLELTNPEKVFTINAQNGSSYLQKSQVHLVQANAGCLIYPGHNNDSDYAGSLALRVYKLKQLFERKEGLWEL